eukprot:1434679-Amphidinium_carterae.1
MTKRHSAGALCVAKDEALASTISHRQTCLRRARNHSQDNDAALKFSSPGLKTSVSWATPQQGYSSSKLHRVLKTSNTCLVQFEPSSSFDCFHWLTVRHRLALVDSEDCKRAIRKNCCRAICHTGCCYFLELAPWAAQAMVRVLQTDKLLRRSDFLEALQRCPSDCSSV